MASPRFLARINPDGHIVPIQPERFKRRAGREVWVSTHDDPVVALRTDNANRYLWGVVYKRISEETGADPESIHYGLKREAVRLGILPPQYILLGDRLIEDDPTTKTDSDTFQAYTTWIRHCALHGDLTGWSFYIPEPNEDSDRHSPVGPRAITPVEASEADAREESPGAVVGASAPGSILEDA